MKLQADKKEKVMRVLSSAGALRLADIAERTNISQAHAYVALFQLARSGVAIHAVPSEDGDWGGTIYYFGKHGKSRWRKLRDRNARAA